LVGWKGGRWGPEEGTASFWEASCDGLEVLQVGLGAVLQEERHRAGGSRVCDVEWLSNSDGRIGSRVELNLGVDTAGESCRGDDGVSELHFGGCGERIEVIYLKDIIGVINGMTINE